MGKKELICLALFSAALCFGGRFSKQIAEPAESAVQQQIREKDSENLDEIIYEIKSEYKNLIIANEKDKTIIVKDPYFMIDKTNLPIFEFYNGREGIYVKSQNWPHIFYEMQIDDFKKYLDSKTRQKGF